VVILGAGFGGLELATVLSMEFSEGIDVTLIDRNDAFVFGYSKLDVMFNRASLASVRMPYRDFVKPGVTLVRQTVTGIDPETRRVTTDSGTHDADFLVIALGADYDLGATPGLAEAGEFYSVAGAARAGELLPEFRGGRVIVGVCGSPIKCPPAPSEAALLLHDSFSRRGIRASSEISFVIPFDTPVPPAPDASRALLAAFAERDIRFVPRRQVGSVDPDHRVAVLDDGTEMPYDLFLGVPKHRAPEAVTATGLTRDGFVPVDPATLETAAPGVYAIGDVAAAVVPKAGVFAEGQGRAVGASLIAALRGGGAPHRYEGRGTCYVEFGGDRVAGVDVDFLSGPAPAGTFRGPSLALVAEKQHFGASRRARWFGR